MSMMTQGGGTAPPRSKERVVLGLASVTSVLVVWEGISRLGLVRPILISSPSAVFEAGLAVAQSGELWRHIAATFAVWATGFVLASTLGIAVGIMAGWFPKFRYIADPWLNTLDSIPTLALIPIFILWFGIGFAFKVFVVFLSTLFLVAVNTMAGVRATERSLLDVASTFGASRRTVLTTVVLPGSVPYILTGLRQGAARALVGVVVAEFVSADRGLGFMISVSGAMMSTARVMFGVVLLTGLGVVLGDLLGRLEMRFDAWRT